MFSEVIKSKIRYEILSQVGEYCIASLRYIDAVDPERIVGYDVFEVQEETSSVIDGIPVTYNRGGGMPSSSSWGRMGWSYSTLTSAQRKLEFLTNQSVILESPRTVSVARPKRTMNLKAREGLAEYWRKRKALRDIAGKFDEPDID